MSGKLSTIVEAKLKDKDLPESVTALCRPPGTLQRCERLPSGNAEALLAALRSPTEEAIGIKKRGSIRLGGYFWRVTRRLPPALDRIIRRCLEKKPEERFQSALDLAFALESLLGTSERKAQPPPRRRYLGRLR